MDRRLDRDRDFIQFVEARSARLLHIAHMLCGDLGLAEDLTQTALEKAYLKWDRIELGNPFAYVRQTIVNEYRMIARRRPWRELLVGGSAEIDAGSTRGRAMDSADPATAVTGGAVFLSMLEELTARERAVVVLRYAEDLTEAETARVLGVATGTIKSTTARALAKLRRLPDATETPLGGRT